MQQFGSKVVNWWKTSGKKKTKNHFDINLWPSTIKKKKKCLQIIYKTFVTIVYNLVGNLLMSPQ